MESHNPEVYKQLLFEFREGLARFGGELFYLMGASLIARQQLPEEETRNTLWQNAGLISVMHGNSDFGFFVWATVGGIGKDGPEQKVVKPARDAWESFRPLAARAGAHLPLTVRRSLPPGLMDDAASWWYSVLYWLQMPHDFDDVLAHRTVPVSEAPFMDSIQAIEYCGLTGPDPRFPFEITLESDPSTGEFHLVYSAEKEEGHNTTQRWWHGPDEQRQGAYNFGPIRGTQKFLSYCVGGNLDAERPRRLRFQAEKGIVWVVRFSGQNWEVWFRSQRAFSEANARKLAQSSDQSAQTKRQ